MVLVADPVFVIFPDKRRSVAVMPVRFNCVPEMPPANVEVPDVSTRSAPEILRPVTAMLVVERSGMVEVAVVEVAVNWATYKVEGTENKTVVGLVVVATVSPEVESVNE